jgi:hypothetical protein
MTQLRYLAAAEAWKAAGCPLELLVRNEYELLAMRCWLQSQGAQGVEEVVEEFRDACVKNYEMDFPNWWKSLLSRREYCDRCGETYKIENLSICTGCMGTYCYKCIDNNHAPNGNRQHGCGGEIVG